jgi:hypothetical protein
MFLAVAKAAILRDGYYILGFSNTKSFENLVQSAV